MGKGRTKVLHEPDCAVIRDVAESLDEGDAPYVVPKCTCAKAKRERRKRAMRRSEGGSSTATLQDGSESLTNGNYRSFAGYYE
jgi:hypothetical protein